MKIISKNVAFYLRLSREDFNNGKNLREESNSISNQRKLMENYVKRRKELRDCVITEYCDDGYTGTNFERPGFLQMVKDAELGKIDTILLKDYSRLGRNFIKVGRYLEEIFPELQIRVISINDVYDSNNLIDVTEGIDVPVKNLFNDFYIKDLSKKVKSGIKTRQKKGEYISANAIFGYKKSKHDIHKLEIDEETAYIVRMIFDYALDGMNSIQIANMLNRKDVKTPAWYKNKSDRRNYEIDDKTMWTSAKVMKIIRDQRYAGDMVGNVRVTTKIARTDNIRVDRKDWIIVERTHEGIVSKEVFFKVNEEVSPLRERMNIQIGDNRRKGFCYCGYCGRLLQKEKNPLNPYLYCTRRKYEQEGGCNELKIKCNSLNEVLYTIVVKYITSLIEINDFVKRRRIDIIKKHKSDVTVGDIEMEIVRLRQSTIGLNQRYHEGQFTKEMYVLQKEKIKMQIEELQVKKLKILNGIGNKEEQDEWVKKLEDMINEYKDKVSFTDMELSALIEKVDVYSQSEFKVKWRFMDFSSKIINYFIITQIER